jgi:hypothetical protein
LRYKRTLGLDDEQLEWLTERVGLLLPVVWDKGFGRPRALCLDDAVAVCLLYNRQNMTEEVIADMYGTCQSVVSGAITTLMPLIERATQDLVPTAEEAVADVDGLVVLVDGALWPCWSWACEPKLWAGKYKTTGHGSLIVTNMVGQIIYVSDPVTGNHHDMAKIDETVEKILRNAGGVIGDKGFIGTDYITTPVRKPKNDELSMNQEAYNTQVSSLRAAVERAVAHLKTWKILFTDYRRPLKTFMTSFKAATGLYFLAQTI